jgi:hypothetical protein
MQGRANQAGEETRVVRQLQLLEERSRKAESVKARARPRARSHADQA